MPKSKLPEHVQTVKKKLSQNPSDPLFEIAQKLINENPDHISMWRSLEKRSIAYDDLWVWAFLQGASDASSLPPYHLMSAKDRRELSDRIEDLTKDLSRVLKANGLDGHIFSNNGKLFHGFFILEDFSEKNQAQVTDKEKIKFSQLIDGFARRSIDLVNNVPVPGKAGKNAEAVRFIRIMVEQNLWKYGTPLNKVIATATNALFDTQYSESDIRKNTSR